MHILKWTALGVGLIGAGIAGLLATGSFLTERDISRFREHVSEIGLAEARQPVSREDIESLPAPVQRYFDFVFSNGVTMANIVRVSAEGQFRRPQTEDFNLTTAEQVIAIGEPALMFSATTPIVPGIWARAYDFFAEGEMEMKAKVMSVLTVVDEAETPELNVISLRRWLLESALFPQALLPGGPVRWEPINEDSARAIVEADGLRATMIAHFDEDGRMAFMAAEEDGDLSTSYHGSGEHVTRSDYREVAGVMVPHRFVISRASGGEIYPFFDAALTQIEFE